MWKRGELKKKLKFCRLMKKFRGKNGRIPTRADVERIMHEAFHSAHVHNTSRDLHRVMRREIRSTYGIVQSIASY
jgi:hypothetical protein